MRSDPNLLPEKIRVRGIYLLPNILTTAALFAAFYSIVAAMKGLFDVAASAIFIAMIADGLDGRVARLTHTQTDFGAQYDSLSDMVAFGVAPALVIYSWSLANLGKIGWVVAFVYTAAAALRLARFNIQPVDYDKRYFQGLPSPPSAAVLAAIVWLGDTYQVSGRPFVIPVAMITLCMAAFMVSGIRYHSFKQLDFKGRVPFIVVAALVFVIAGVAMAPAQVLFIVFITYAVSGPIITLWQLRKVKQRYKLEGKRKK